MRIFKVKWFSKFAEKEGISDEELKDIVKLVESGQYDVNLGGGKSGALAYSVFKKGVKTFLNMLIQKMNVITSTIRN
jgi:hypothetical protein